MQEEAMTTPEAESIANMLRAGRRHMPASLAGLREWVDKSLGHMPMEATVQRRDVEVAGRPAAWFTPPSPREDTAILYLHGGGYIMGSLESHAALTSHLAAAADIPVLSLAYRLAPEHPFPAQLEDAVAAYRWLLDAGYAPEKLAIAGDSAGGGLTLTTLCDVRDAGLPLPAAAAVLSPWTDLEGLGESARERAPRDPMLRPEDQPAFQRLFLGGHDPRDPRAAPLYADLTGLPPLLVQVGGNEILYDDATRIADRAREAGVDVTLDIWESMFHVWHLFAPVMEEGREGIRQVAAFLGERIH
jgi:monoterpene epsilon-lactone hydrolase